MNFVFHPEAVADLNDAVDYYSAIDVRLGFDFSLEVYATIQRSIDFPKAWPVLDGEVRRSLVSRFPYGILYSEEPDGIYIVAVMNLHRQPSYWHDRT